MATPAIAVQTVHGTPARGNSPLYTYFVIFLLLVAYMVAVMDRFLIGLVIAPIKQEFGIGDAGIGLLIGFGFVIFYSVLGVPFGAAADRTNRRNLIVLGLVAWTLATAACGLATGFISLLIARAMVGVGEATLTPAALSTISDRVERNRLSFAISIYAIGTTIGAGVAMGLGGILVAWSQDTVWTVPIFGGIGGWRLAFMVVGIAGLPLALLMVLTMREAPRRVPTREAPPIRDLGRVMAAHPRAFFGVFAGLSAAAISAYIPSLWTAALFSRVHQFTPVQIGMTFGPIFGIGGSLGILGGGVLADWFTRRGMRDGPTRVIFLALIVQLPLNVIAYVTTDTTIALVCFTLGLAATSVFNSLQSSTIQLLTPPLLRGRMMAVYLLCITIVGMGAGPLLVGWLSEHYAGLGPAMAIATTLSVVIALIILSMTRGNVVAAIAEQDRATAGIAA